MYNFYTPVTNRTEYNGALTRHNELFDLKSSIRHAFPFLIFLLKFLLTHHFCLSTPFSFLHLKVCVCMEMAPVLRKNGEGLGRKGLNFPEHKGGISKKMRE